MKSSVKANQTAWNNASMATAHLDLAVAPGAWLMPSRMVINTGNVVGYNIHLKQAGPGISFGVNNGLNQGTKISALHLMGGRAFEGKRPK